MIRVAFTIPVDPATITAGGVGADPKTFSFRVDAPNVPGGFMPGSIQVDGPRVIRFVVDPNEQFQIFKVGEYRVTVFGDAAPPLGRPAIATPAGSRLNGEHAPGGAYPTGVGGPGGTLTFSFNVVP